MIVFALATDGPAQDVFKIILRPDRLARGGLNDGVRGLHEDGHNQEQRGL